MKMLQVATKQAIKKQCDISYAIHDHSESSHWLLHLVLWV